MRFSIIYLVSLLLVPSLVVSKQYEPPSPSPPLPSRTAPRPAHGDVVRFQGPLGQHLGVVVGSPQHQGGNVNVAPLAPHSPLPPNRLIVANDHLVNTHPGNVARTRYTAQHLASNLQTHHQNNPPNLRWASGAVEGSPNHRPVQQVSGHVGSHRPTRAAVIDEDEVPDIS